MGDKEALGGRAQAVKHGEGKGLIGKKVQKNQIDGDVEDYDEKTNLYKVKFADDHVEQLKWTQLKNCVSPMISFKRFSQKKKDASAERDEADGEAGDGALETSSDDGDDENTTDVEAETGKRKADVTVQADENRKEQKEERVEKSPSSDVARELKLTVKETTVEVVVTSETAERKETKSEMTKKQQLTVMSKKRKAPVPRNASESEQESEQESDEQEDESEEEETEANDDENEEDEEGSSDGEDEDGEEEDGEQAEGGDSDSSLNESDLEMITRKPKKKKRKHVLTLQRWRGYKKKRKLAAELKKAALLAADPEAAAAAAAEDQVVTDAMEEVAPRKKSRTRKLAEVDEIQRKRQKIASELKQKLKARNLKRASKHTPAKREVVEDEHEEPAVEATPLAAKVDADETRPSPYPDSKPSPFDRGIKLRGRKLRKVFKGKLTRGEIADYDRRTRYYKVRYEDGEVEKLMWKNVEPMLVPFEQLQTWNDPESEAALVSSYRSEAAEKHHRVKEKTPKLKPQPVKRR